LNEKKRTRARLTILGYTGNLPRGAPTDMKPLIEESPYIYTLPRFSSFDGDIVEALHNAHAYITFSYRDPCPNAVVEGMSYGLPVVGVASGGLPDIVGDAGELVAFDDPGAEFFSAYRFEYNFPSIDFELVYMALEEILNHLDDYRARVRRRFFEQLDIDVVAKNYGDILRNIMLQS